MDKYFRILQLDPNDAFLNDIEQVEKCIWKKKIYSEYYICVVTDGKQFKIGEVVRFLNSKKLKHQIKTEPVTQEYVDSLNNKTK